VYKIDETVLYGVNGICTITDIEEKKINKEIKKYYVLKPVYNKSSTLYVPVDNELLVSKMKKILSKKEIFNLIDSINEKELIWIENEQERNRTYNEILKSGDRKEIMKMLRSLHNHRIKLKDTGRKFHVADEKIMRAAEGLLHEEFAYVLDIKKENVTDFIVDHLAV